MLPLPVILLQITDFAKLLRADVWGLFLEGTPGAERGGPGADREAGSRLEEHTVSDGEKDAQS